MTYPSGSGVINNNWGPAEPNAPVGTIPPATGTITVPQDPSGVILEFVTSTIVNGAPGTLVQNNSPSEWEFTNGELAAENYTAEMVTAAHMQQGSPVQNSVVSFNSLNAASFQKFSWE